MNKFFRLQRYFPGRKSEPVCLKIYQTGGIQYEEMDEINTGRNYIFHFSLVLPGTHFCADKYPMLLNMRKK
jgi:hypothetical protein